MNKDKEIRAFERNWMIEKWAKHVKEKPLEVWKKEHTLFVNDQLETAQRFYQELAKTEEGRIKIELIKKERFMTKTREI